MLSFMIPGDKSDQNGTQVKEVDPITEDHSEQYHALFDSHIDVKYNSAVRLENEIKRIGYIMDIYQQPRVQLRIGDRLTIYLQ